MIYWTYSKPTGNGTSATAAARGRARRGPFRADRGRGHLRSGPAFGVADALRLPPRLRRRGPCVHHHGRALHRGGARARPGPGRGLRQGDPPRARRLGPGGQPVRRGGRRRRERLELRPPQHPERGDPSRDRGALDRRARPAGRRRDQPDRAGRELRLAGRQLRRELRRHPGRRRRARAPRASSSRATTGTR